MQYWFRDCELDERTRTLRRGGAGVPLEPKAFDLLTCLLENRDRVVSRRELFERLWPGQFVGDAALSRCVQLARRAIGDRARSASAIHTFHRRGYRFIAAVRTVAVARSADAEACPAYGLAGGRYPLAGRAAEIDTLLAAWAHAAGGRQLLALVTGEPGIGKTRLAEELADRVQREAGAVLRGGCEEVAALPFQPFTEALRTFLEADPPKDVLEGLNGCRFELARLVPELSAVLGAPPPVTSDVEVDRYRLFEAILRWLDVACERGPVLLILEDLQWASGQTLLLLRHVARSSGARRLLVVATYRDTDLHPAQTASEVLASLLGEPGVIRVPLQALDVAAVEAFLRAAGGAALAPVAGELAHLVCRRSGGNPFLLTELVCGLRQSDAPAASSERLFDEARSSLSAGVRTLVRHRLRRLSDAAVHALPLASVAGYEFRFGVVAGVAGLSEDRLLAALEEGSRARLVEHTSPGTYRFFHHIVREVLYEDLGAAQKAGLHLRIAQTIESLHGPDADTHLGALAHHYERAGAGGRLKAVEYAVRAAERAVASLAHGLAAVHYRHALEMLDGESDPLRRIDLLIRLGEARRDAGEPGFGGTLLEAARLAESAGDGENLVRAALANTRGFASTIGAVDAERVAVIEAALRKGPPAEGPPRARLLALLGSELAFSADVERPRALADKALAMARRLGDRRTLAEVLARRYLIAATPDTLNERLAYTAELDSLGSELGDPTIRHWALVARATAFLESGDIDGFDRSLDLCAEAVAELGHPMQRWGLLRLQAQRAVLAGRVAETEALIDEAYDLGRASGQVDAALVRDYSLVGVRRLQGRLNEMEPTVHRLVAEHPGLPALGAVAAAFYCEIGREKVARPLLDEAVRTSFEGVRWDVSWITTMTAYAYAAARLRERRGARVLYSRLAPFARRVEVNGGTVNGCVAHYLGLLAAALERFDDAVHQFAVAEAVHRRLGGPFWILATEVEHARVLLARGGAADGQGARALLRKAARHASEQGFPSLESEARRLQRTVELRQARATQTPAARSCGRPQAAKRATVRRF